MATMFKIPLPSGSTYDIFYSKGQDRIALIQTFILDYWAEYIESNWMRDVGVVGGGEERVKRMLDACGYMLLRGVEFDNEDAEIITEHAELMNFIREIPLSSCSDCSAADAVYSSLNTGEYTSSRSDAGGADVLDYHLNDVVLGKPTPKYRVKPEDVVFNKLMKLKESGLYTYREWHRVDSCGKIIFENSDKTVIIVNHGHYKPRETGEGVLFRYDRVLVCKDREGNMAFFDEKVDRIKDEFIKM